MSKKKKEEPEFDIVEFDLNLYRLCLANGDWYNAHYCFDRVHDLVRPEVFRVLVAMGRRKAPMEKNDVELSEATKTLLIHRADAGCVSCRYILDDWAKNNKLTDYGNYPPEAKINHIEAEKAGEV